MIYKKAWYNGITIYRKRFNEDYGVYVKFFKSKFGLKTTVIYTYILTVYDLFQYVAAHPKYPG